MPSAPRRPRPGSRRPTTSTAATTRAAAISRSTRGAACAGARPRRSCARRARAPNLTVLTHAQATRIAFDGRRAVGLHFRHQGAGRLCRGAGRGGAGERRDRLAAAAAALRHRPGRAAARSSASRSVHEQPGVGANLQDHLQLRLIYRVEGTRTLNEQAARLLARGWMGLEYLLFRRGPLTMAPSQLGAFARSDRSRATPNLEYHIQPLSLDKFGEPLHRFPAFTASVCNLRPESRGTVRIKSARAGRAARDPAELPRHPRRSPGGRRRDPADAADLRCRSAGAVPAAGAQARGRLPERRRSWPRPRARSAPPSSTRSAPAGWAPDPRAVVDERLRLQRRRAGCASPTPRSCRPSPRATPTRR